MYWWDGSNLDVHTVATPSVGVWHHIVAVNENNTTRRIYVDGQLQSGTNYLDNAGTRDLTNNLAIGNHQSAGTESFDGQIDDVRIYNYPLTSAQIKTVYNEGAAVRFGPQTGSP